MTTELITHEAVTDAQRTILTQKTPTEVIKHRKGRGGRQFAYVEHAWVTEQLNLAFNWAWSWEILEWRLVPEDEPAEVFVLGRLTVHTPRGDIVKSQFGQSDIKRDQAGNILGIGDDLKAASSDGLKKAASLLGLALDLYRSDEDRSPAKAETKAKPQPSNGNGKAKAPDSMTVYWQAVKAKGLPPGQGQAILAKNAGDPVKALADLEA